MQPKITVLMPVYNSEPYLRQAIESILDQTYKDFELLVINDGSYDHSENILHSYSDSRIRVVRNAKNIGLISTLNKGIDLSRGEFIARMDSDDFSSPQRLEKQLHFLTNNPAVGVCGTAVEVMDSDIKWQYPEDPNVMKCMFLFACPIAHPSVMIRKSILLESGIRYRNFTHAEDYFLWVELTGVTQVTTIPDVLLSYRRHSNQVSTKFHKLQKINSCRIKLYQLNRLGIQPSAEEWWLHNRIPENAVRDHYQNKKAWFNKIFQHNELARIYESKTLEQLLNKICEEAVIF